MAKQIDKVDETKFDNKDSESGKMLDTNFYFDNCKYFGHVSKDCYHIIGFSEKKTQDKKHKKAKEF